MLMRTPTRWARPKRLRPPGFIVPCQPILARAVPAGDARLHELKHDGYRVVAFKDGDRVRLWSRNGRDWASEFVAITEALRGLPYKRVTTARRSRTASRACRTFIGSSPATARRAPVSTPSTCSGRTLRTCAASS